MRGERHHKFNVHMRSLVTKVTGLTIVHAHLIYV